MKRMLFNATQAEELRVAIVDGQKLIDLDIESAAKEQRKSNIYKGVITRIEPSLEACFVNYGTDRHGFLPLKEVAKAALNVDGDFSRQKMIDSLKVGTELIVQVEKDERGNKGAALTSFISLAGRYLVLMPNNPRGGGVSRRIEGEDRNELKETLSQLDIPQGMSVIGRTAGIGRNAEELQWDLNYLLQLWKAIDEAAKGQTGAFLIYQESSLVIRAIRDYYTPDIGEILIDTEEIAEQAKGFMQHVMPTVVNRVKLYRDDVPLFSRFQIEHQIESAFSRQVDLPSGGAIVIDHTEALVAIDVNSARATKGADIEATATNTNLEAAEEIARQLRLRDLGGLIVIDFIDMEEGKNQRAVEDKLRDALKLDRARVQVSKISKFGLLELSRQRLKPSLGESAHIPCPRCHGIGHIRGTESIALHILRIMQEEAMKDNTAQVIAQVPVEVATYLLNEKRVDIQSLESRLKVSVVLVPNMHMETPNYMVQRLRHEDLNAGEAQPVSYKMVEAPEQVDLAAERKLEAKQVKPEAAVKGITPSGHAPMMSEPAIAAAPVVVPNSPPILLPPQKKSLIASIKTWLGFGPPEVYTPPPTAAPAAPASADKKRDDRNNRDRTERGDRNRNRSDNKNDRSDRSNRDRDDRNGRRDRNNKDRNERNDRGGEKRERQGQSAPEAQIVEPSQTDGVRSERAGNDRGERGGRNERNDRGDRNNERGERKERPPKPPRSAAPVDEPSISRAATPPESPHVGVETNGTNMPTQVAGNIAAGEGGERGTRRRDRTRRDREPRRDRNDREAGTGNSDVASGGATTTAAEGMPVVASAVASAAASPRSANDAPVSQIDLPHFDSRVKPPAAADVTAEVAPKVIVAAAPTRPATPAPTMVFAKPEEVGLQMVETRSDVSVVPSFEPSSPPAPRRTRPPRAELKEEPLQQVETK